MKLTNKAYFVAGTDTGVGKTLVCAALSLASQNYFDRCALIKPVQTGVSGKGDDDVSYYRQMLPESVVIKNFGMFRAPLSPHEAAILEERDIDPETLVREIKQTIADFPITIIEGVGGLMVPLTRQYHVIDLIKDLNISVILVTANRLGTLNHSLLSLAALKSYAIEVAAVLLNTRRIMEDDLSQTRNFVSLRTLVPDVPLLEISYVNNPNDPQMIREIFSKEILSFDHAEIRKGHA